MKIANKNLAVKTMNENIVMKLTSKDDKYACAIADKIIAESQETDEWYEYFDDFASLLDYPKSLVVARRIEGDANGKLFFQCLSR